jgi:hypothetical protein
VTEVSLSHAEPPEATDEAFELLLDTWRDSTVVRLFTSPAQERARAQDYARRRQLLLETVADLRGRGMPTMPVWRALARAKAYQLQAAHRGYRTDLARELIEERNLIAKHLKPWVRRAIVFYRDHARRWLLGQGPGPITLRLRRSTIQVDADTIATTIEFETAYHLARVLDALDHESIWKTQSAVPLRRPRRGRQATPWLATVRGALYRAQVTPAEMELLLEAVGLLTPSK